MTKVKLFHWDKCGHCVAFKPQWEALKELFNKNNVEHEEYEYTTHPDVIEKENISAFPTITVEKNDKRTVLEGGTVDDIINTALPNLQMGGGKRKQFRKKALIDEIIKLRSKLN